MLIAYIKFNVYLYGRHDIRFFYGEEGIVKFVPDNLLKTRNQDGRHQKEDEVDQGRDRPAIRHHRQVRERHQGGGHHLQGGGD